MDVLEIHKAVTRQFGDETGAMIDINDTIRWINNGQFQIARRIGDVLTPLPIPVVVGTYQYVLPTNFFKIKSVELDGKRLQVVTPAQLSTLYPDLNSDGAQQSVPKFVAFQATGTNTYQMTAAPIPGTAGTFDLIYQSRPPIINASTDPLYIPEEYHQTLVTYCLAQAKQMDGDDEAHAALQSQYRQEVAEDSHDSNVRDDETYSFIRTSAGDYGGWG